VFIVHSFHINIAHHTPSFNLEIVVDIHTYPHITSRPADKGHIASNMALQTPSLTLYVTNLEGKTKKPELKASLYALFTPYGRV